MAIRLQLRRGTKAQHNSFIGAVGEVTVITDEKRLSTHDGTTLGGIPLAKQSEIPTNYVTTNSAQTISAKKTLSVLPESSVVQTIPIEPTANAQFVTKYWIDKWITTTVSNAVTTLNAAISAVQASVPANADLVHTKGNETIAGTKTFSSPVVVATPSADTHATTKKYVDEAIKSAIKATFNLIGDSLYITTEDNGD